MIYGVLQGISSQNKYLFFDIIFLEIYLIDSLAIKSAVLVFIQILILCSQSHQAGPGPQFQRFAFNLHGKSPLIAHFLSANRLQIEEPAKLKKLVTRTEVEKYPYPFVQSIDSFIFKLQSTYAYL